MARVPKRQLSVQYSRQARPQNEKGRVLKYLAGINKEPRVDPPGLCFMWGNIIALFTTLGSCRKVVPGLCSVLRMGSEQLATYAAVKRAGGMPRETHNPASQGNGDIFAT